MVELDIHLPELVTQPQVLPHVVAHAKLITCVPVSGYLCDVYGHPLFMKILKKNRYGLYITPVRLFNQLDGLIGVIWVILSKK